MKFFAIIFGLSLLGSGIGVQNSFADTCDSIESAFYHNPEQVAIVSITITSSEIEIHDPPLLGTVNDYRTTVSSNFTIDEIIYGNKEFPLKSDSIKVSNVNSPMENGSRYVLYYAQSTSHWYPVNTCVSFYSLSVIDYVDFFADLKSNPCDIDKNYLIKKTNFDKICVSRDTRDQLIQRDYGFYIPSLFYSDWKKIIQEISNDINPHSHKISKLSCNLGGIALAGDHCIPFNIFLRLNEDNTKIKHLITNSFGQIVTASLTTDKQEYTYPEKINISGQFSRHIGDSVALLSSDKGRHLILLQQIPIDSENRFSLQLDKDSIIKIPYAKNQYLQLGDIQQGLFNQTKFSYVVDKEILIFNYWKKQIQQQCCIKDIEEYLLRQALFDAQKIDRFFKLYPKDIFELRQDSRPERIELPKIIELPEIEVFNDIIEVRKTGGIQITNWYYDYDFSKATIEFDSITKSATVEFGVSESLFTANESFTVLVDGQKIDHTEIYAGTGYRQLEIELIKGNHIITIIGDKLVNQSLAIQSTGSIKFYDAGGSTRDTSRVVGESTHDSEKLTIKKFTGYNANGNSFISIIITDDNGIVGKSGGYSLPNGAFSITWDYPPNLASGYYNATVSDGSQSSTRTLFLDSGIVGIFIDEFVVFSPEDLSIVDWNFDQESLTLEIELVVFSDRVEFGVKAIAKYFDAIAVEQRFKHIDKFIVMVNGDKISHGESYRDANKYSDAKINIYFELSKGINNIVVLPIDDPVK